MRLPDRLPADIAGPADKVLGTREMGDQVVRELEG